MEYGLIGNCSFNALINRKGDVSWLCWPRFDSSFVFGSILDSKVGGHFQISSVDHTIEGRQSYIVNTNVLTTTFQDDRGEFEIIDFAPRFHHFHRYYKPNMLMRIVRPISGQTHFGPAVDQSQFATIL
jgi:GH15 family glucan-1,4-alpha-glucosidase